MKTDKTASSKQSEYAILVGKSTGNYIEETEPDSRPKHSRNIIYWIIVSITLMMTILVAVIYAKKTQKISVTYAILIPIFADIYVLLILGIASLFMRILIPSRVWNWNRCYFRVREKEIKFYNKLRIKSWKDRIPELGKTGGFQKRKLVSLETEYLERFLQETCFAEAMHLTAGIVGFSVLFFFPKNAILIGIPLVIVNFILNILPCVVQRFTRYRLFRIYQHQKSFYKQY